MIDKATYEEPFQYPEGIRAVVVNGQIAFRDGERTKAAAGNASSRLTGRESASAERRLALHDRSRSRPRSRFAIPSLA